MTEENTEIRLLYCPATAKLVPYVASDSDRIDIGSIAKVFGLEPATLKINGHYIGRGPDLVSSSLTWRGLISFFSGRGLPTGAHSQQPIVIHGRILKPGNKRTYEPSDDEPMCSVRGKTLTASVGLSKKCKLAKNKGSHGKYDVDTAGRLCHKRKNILVDNLSLMKKLKINETESIEGQSRKPHNLFSEPLKTHFPCGYSSQKLKRTREEETVVPMIPKRIK